MPASILQIPVGPMANFSYLVVCSVTNKAVLIDVGWDAKKLYDEIVRRGLSFEAVLLTHTHFDHVKALPELLKRSYVPVWVHASEQKGVPGKPDLKLIDDGSIIPLGNLKIRCHHTPGHSPGGVCFEVEKHLITGDTLFVDACGRVDLPGSDQQAMQASLRKLAAFPDDTIIYPGHDYGPTPTSTIGDQKRTNYYLREAMGLMSR
ncbi:MAG: MBL fold metallo-hydrolase [Deltaproteobacteria bacterium]|nr:MBL fold metallo-hydrolase [Deltaproteobacteria bacterium]